MIWTSSLPETTCGPGSTMAATGSLRAWLPDALRRHGVRLLLDAPCGDRNWIRHTPLPCAYVGVDNELEHVEKARCDLETVWLLDIRQDPLPKADAILSRDFFQHLPLAQCAAALANMRSTGARLLFATCHGAEANAEIQHGGFRPVNMRQPPFALADPIDHCADGSARILGVWTL